MAGTYTVTASLTDTLAGLDTLTFPTTTSPGDTYDAFNGATTATQAHIYTTDASDTFSDLVQIDATDRAGNLSSYLVTVINDDLAPTPVITVPATTPLKVTIAWGGSDAEAGARHFDVQYKQGAGSWTAWLTATTETNAQFIGQQDESYTFRVRASDNVGNESGWVESASTTVDAVTKYYHPGSSQDYGTSRVAMRQGGEVYYLYGDHLGSTSLTTDDQGNVVHEARYLPFGEERWVDGEGVTDFTFTGQRVDGFGLSDYNARYYSSYLNRFVSPDTIIPDYKNPQSLNRYSYVLNNPIKFVDPTGHYTFEKEPDDLLFVPPKKYPQFNPTDEAMRKSDFRCIADCPPSKAPDAALIGASGSASVKNLFGKVPPLKHLYSFAERYGVRIPVGFVGGAEALFHLDNREVDLFFYLGAEGGIEKGSFEDIGAGINGSGYAGIVFNLPSLRDYKGPFQARTATAAAGPGIAATHFWSPDPSSETYGYALGIAAGASWSVTQNTTYYISTKEGIGLLHDSLQTIKAEAIQFFYGRPVPGIFSYGR